MDVEHWYSASVGLIPIPPQFHLVVAGSLNLWRWWHTCVVRLSPLEAIQRRAWVTASISIVKLEVETVWAALSSWMVVAPCWTVKPHPEWSVVTESLVCTVRSCGFRFSWLRTRISAGLLALLIPLLDPSTKSETRMTASVLKQDWLLAF